MIKNEIMKDFTLAKNWENLEASPDTKLQYRWSKASSSIYIAAGHNYTNLKVRVYNGTNVFKKRILNVLLDHELYKSYIFSENLQNLDIKIEIINKKCITFSTEDVFCPAKIDRQSRDDRNLGFKFYAFVIDSESSTDNLIPVNELRIEADEEFFVDSSNYAYQVSQLIVNNNKATIHYTGQYGTSGYATAARGYIYKYFTNGFNIKWNPLKFDETILSHDCPYNIVTESTISNNYVEYDTFIYHSTPDIWETLNHQYDQLNRKKKRIGYTVWETSKLPLKWANYINDNVDVVRCPSSYNFHVFKASGVTIPIEVEPHIFLYRPLLDKKDINLTGVNGQFISNSEEIYTFYTIGELNTRKGISDLVTIFCETFTKFDKVRLIVKTHYKNYTPGNKRYCLDRLNDIVKKFNNPPEIHYLMDNLSERGIVALHSLGDCYVSLTKSEGFGMTIFDAINYKKPVIVTNYSGHMDFIPKNYPGLVNFKLDYVRDMQEFSQIYAGDTVWAYPDLEHAKELLKNYREY